MTGYYRWDLERCEWRAWVAGAEDCRWFKHRYLLNDFMMDRRFVSWSRV